MLSFLFQLIGEEENPTLDFDQIKYRGDCTYIVIVHHYRDKRCFNLFQLLLRKKSGKKEKNESGKYEP